MATKSTTRKSTARGRSKAAATRARNAAQQRARRQMHALILFTVGLFMGALTLFKGVSLWYWMHNIMFGIFGAGSVFVSILLIYIAVLLTMDKPWKARVWESSFLLAFFCGAWQIFSMGIPESTHMLDMIVECIIQGLEGKSGGLIGAATGLPLLLCFGKLGAGITIVLLIFVFAMLITGSTLIGVARAAHKPVRKLEESYAEQMQRMEQRRVTHGSARNVNIDIPLDNPPAAAAISAKPVPEASLPEVVTPGDLPQTSAAPQNTKFNIDIPLDDEFDTAKSGGFALAVADSEPMQFVQAQPSLDELVNSAATESGKFEFKADSSPSKAAEKSESESNSIPEHLLEKISASEAQKTAPAQEERKPADETAGAVVVNPAQPSKPSTYALPQVDLLQKPKYKNEAGMADELKSNAQRLVDTLSSFGVQTRIVDISRGPAVTRYELQPSAGVKISKITGLADDIALNLAAAGVRIEAPIPNKAAVGIEVPNKVVSTVTIREIIDSDAFRSSKSKLSAALGRDIAGKVTLANIEKMPHLLIAGSTGSGKSVCINSIIISLLFKSAPDEVRFLMIDPKVVELGVYNGIPQLLVPVVTDPKKAAGALSWAVTEMLKRYKLFADNSVRDLKSYNRLAEKTEGMEKLPQIVIIIDELADLMMAAPNEIEDYICRLAQMARAAGMHLIIATQRPSVDVITGVIKANIPSRIAFAVSSQIDSRTILDMGGAEKLLGRGDMLFNPVGCSKPIRVQGCFVTDKEIENVINFIKNDAVAKYDDSIVQEIDNHVVSGKGGRSGGVDSSSDSEDEMLLPAIECVVEAGMASTSMLQRRLKLGYARAARIVDDMEAKGIIGPFEGSKPRQVLISPERWAEMKLARQD